MTDNFEQAARVIELIKKSDLLDGVERQADDPEARRLEYRQERIEHVGQRVPARYTKLDDKEARRRAPALEEVDIEGLALTPRSLLICGATGLGKTTLAATLMRAMMVLAYRGDEYSWRAMRTAWFHVASDLARAIEQVAPWEECKTAELATSASWLCIDDLGTERGDRAIDEICRIISHRYNEELPTVITTAMSFDEMTRRYGEGIVRRLIEVPDSVIELGANR